MLQALGVGVAAALCMPSPLRPPLSLDIRRAPLLPRQRRRRRRHQLPTPRQTVWRQPARQRAPQRRQRGRQRRGRPPSVELLAGILGAVPGIRERELSEEHDDATSRCGEDRKLWNVNVHRQVPEERPRQPRPHCHGRHQVTHLPELALAAVPARRRLRPVRRPSLAAVAHGCLQHGPLARQLGGHGLPATACQDARGTRQLTAHRCKRCVPKGARAPAPLLHQPVPLRGVRPVVSTMGAIPHAQGHVLGAHAAALQIALQVEDIDVVGDVGAGGREPA
mmetsp:Transcript_12500/g.33589  ORF Transcript_12500/g.33589 Transcript_12500/m.33589 type:complete len:279 (+) Transcript_12500:186-1022(+)